MRVPSLDDIYRHTGRVVVSCADLEWIAYGAVLQFEPKAASRERANQEFKDRVLSLIEMSRCLPASGERQDWLQLWEKVLSLIQDRNAILHNPLMFDVMENAAGEQRINPHGRIHVFRKRRPQTKLLTVAFIQETADKAERYAIEAMRLWGELFPAASLFEDDD